MDWVKLKPVAYIAATLVLAVVGPVVGGGIEKKRGEERVQKVTANCQQKTDSLTRIIEVQRIREELRAERAGQGAKARVRYRSAPSRCDCEKSKVSVWGIVGPALGFVAGVVVGHSWEATAVTQVVSVVTERGDHPKHWKHKHRRK